MEPKELPSNEAWGRRSGARHKDGMLVFRAVQFGSGSSGNRAAFRTPLKNVPRKWFGKNYKSKRSGALVPIKGKK